MSFELTRGRKNGQVSQEGNLYFKVKLIRLSSEAKGLWNLDQPRTKKAYENLVNKQHRAKREASEDFVDLEYREKQEAYRTL